MAISDEYGTHRNTAYRLLDCNCLVATVVAGSVELKRKRGNCEACAGTWDRRAGLAALCRMLGVSISDSIIKHDA